MRTRLTRAQLEALCELLNGVGYKPARKDVLRRLVAMGFIHEYRLWCYEITDAGRNAVDMEARP
jgi:hypothetical protein